MTLAIDREDRNAATSIITLRGELMLGEGSAQLGTLVLKLIEGGRNNLVFDLSGVTHIDSTGMGRFIDTYTRLEKTAGEMRLAGAKGAVRDSFHVTRLDTVFRFYPTVDEACKGLN